MASRPYTSKQKPFLLSLIFFSVALIFLTVSLNVSPKFKNPPWFDIIAKDIKSNRKIKFGLVDADYSVKAFLEQQDSAESVSVDFDRVGKDKKWEDFFPEWIDEYEKWEKPKCPEIPMPRLEEFRDLDVVVARVPCGGGAGVRDVFRLQVNLVVANLVVGSGWVNPDLDRTVYVVFIGSCGPMWEIFRCDDLVAHVGDYWVYKPELRRLKHKVLMPVGSCQIAPPFAETGKAVWRHFMSQTKLNETRSQKKVAYATVLHSSEAYVCGAIALAQSIRQTHSTKHLLLLADTSITPTSIRGLRAAGWNNIIRIQRIRSPHAHQGSYNEWNYSKLRVWQLTAYEKIIFIDADFILLNNIDHFFTYPQLSAAPNDKVLFNSGVMVVEPSQCMFRNLMDKSHTLSSYNGGDQGFLNEVFTWWHRLPSTLNHLKTFPTPEKRNNEVPDNVYAIHYLGLKPWVCYRDYDCNWDQLEKHIFASDLAHAKWWEVYDKMPKRLQAYCGLTESMEERMRKWRGRARNDSLPDGHWKIKVTDPRHHHI